MPFKAPYRSYQPGDLFYGLGWKRAELMQTIAKGQIPHGEKMGWIDLFLEPVDQYKTPEARLLNDEFAEMLLNHPKYKCALDENKVGIEGNAEWRAKSKGGLLWATTVAKKHVHFCLEGLVMEEVVNKNYPGRAGTAVGRDRPAAPGQLKERSITGAELRWIYRWRNNPDVKAYIQFWKYDSFHKKYKQVLPPWEWHNSVWANYIPKKVWPVI